MRSPKKAILLVLGFLSLILGIIGIFTPLLPTTPFILLAGYCFSKSSERFYTQLLNHNYTRQIIISWERDRSIPLKAKIFATTMLALSAGVIIIHPRIPELSKGFALAFLLLLAGFILRTKSKSTD